MSTIALILKLKKELFLLTFFLGILGCDQDDGIDNDDCLMLSEIPILAISAPPGGTVNERIDVEVGMSFPSSCTSFNGFEETTDANIRTIKAKPIELCRRNNSCATIILTVETYEFIATEPGTYTLNFVSDGNSVKTIEIVIG